MYVTNLPTPVSRPVSRSTSRSGNEYNRTVSKVQKIVSLVNELPTWTFRQLRDQVMEIHRANGTVFNNTTVQIVLGLAAPKRWSDCCKADVVKLLAHWYRIKQWQTAVSYWEPGNFHHTPIGCDRPVASQRAELGDATVLWTTRFGTNNRNEANRILREVSAVSKVACLLKREQVLVKPNGKTEKVRFETECRYEIKAWGVRAEFIDSYVGLAAWNAVHDTVSYPYPPNVADTWEAKQRTLDMLYAYASAQTKGDLSRLKQANGGRYTDRELYWVLNVFALTAYSKVYESVMALCAVGASSN